MQPLNGVQQAGVDRAQRMAQMLEQRHLQVEMAAAAYAREDRRHAQEVPGPVRSERAHAGERDGGGGAHRHGGGRPRDRRDPDVPARPDDPGRRVDLSA
ncbi:MAG: hypothetical protein AB1416_11370 [Actinomycetota bacterium]